MTHRERMLAAIQGKGCDRLPWMPRLDLWYSANRLAGTLPPRYRAATLRELTDDLDMGFHAVIPNFRDLRTPDDDADCALGVFNLWTMPYRTRWTKIERRIRREGDLTRVEYDTPFGTLRTVTLYDQGMRNAGISLAHTVEHAVKSPDDFNAVAHLFENAEVEPNAEGFSEFDRQTGEAGLAIGFVSLSASPMHLLQRELMSFDQFCFALNDVPEKVAGLMRAMDCYWRKVMDVCVAGPARVLLVGANFDATITYPPHFREHFLPWLKIWAEALHGRGKYLLSHPDGENSGLLECYLESGMDVADSICPTPMTRLSLKEVRDAFRGKITIMGGIPSVALLPSSMPDREFEIFLDDFFRQLGTADRHILGISDTTPPGADFNRLLRIGERVKALGPVPIRL